MVLFTAQKHYSSFSSYTLSKPKALPKPNPTELLGKGKIQQEGHLAKLPPSLLIPIVEVE